MFKLFSNSMSFFSIIILFDLSYSFNVDTEHPIVLEPSSLQKSANENSDFGASVVIHHNKYSRILIGAPKAYSLASPFKRTGAVFDCQLVANNSRSKCKQIDDPTNKFFQPLDEMHIGSSISSKPKSSLAFACAHLRIKAVQDYNFPNGACYTIKLNEQSAAKYDKMMIPFENLQQTNGKNYHFSHGMFGFSILFIEDYNRLILGAPGFSTWKGAIVIYNKPDDSSSVQIKHIDSPADSYFGYSLAAGHFFRDNKLYIASGAPKHGHNGAIFYFKIEDLSGSSRLFSMIHEFQQLKGQDIGEYFGYSILIIDINGDSFDDLIVGAPFYSPDNSRRGDIGRCYIYLSNGETFVSPVFLYGSYKPKSRFGSSLAQIGDINADGYNDVVIGAPFEDECGAVYIYHGSKSGLYEPYSQRISACSDLGISKGLKGFGFSLSKGFDIDGNQYPDLLIGSPLTDSAIILRSKPIGSLQVSMKFDVISIDLNKRNCKNLGSNGLVPCFSLTYCMVLKGSYLNGFHEINFTLEVDKLARSDEIMSRGYFITNNVKSKTISRQSVINAYTEYCEKSVQIMLNNEIRDKLTPMLITLRYELASKAVDFCTNCPQFIGSQSISNQISFETGCGTDGVCTSDVSLSVKLANESSPLKTVIEGLHDSVNLLVSLFNSGENAHSSKLTLIVEPPLKTAINDYDILNDTLVVTRDVGNPFGPGSIEFDIQFDLKSSIIYDQTRINFTCIFTTRSDLKSQVDGSIKKFLSIPVERLAKLSIDGTLSDSIFFDHPETRSLDHKKFVLLFTIRKSKYSSIRNPIVAFNLPVSSSGSNFIYEPKIESIGATPISCEPLGLDSIPKDDQSLEGAAMSEALKSSDQLQPNRQKRDVREDNQESDSLVGLDCSTVTCKRIECKLGSFGTGDKVTKIKMFIAIDLKKLEKSFGYNIKEFNYSVEAKAKFLDKMVKGYNQWSQPTMSEIQLKQLPYKEAVSLLIILSCSFVGLLLLLLIIIALIKVGFFKRKKREQIEVLKQRYSMAINPNLLKELGLNLHGTEDSDADSQGSTNLGKS